MLRAYNARKEEVSDFLNKNISEMTDLISLKKYMANVNFSKFKTDVSPAEIMQMLAWITEGYLQEQMRKNSPLDFDDLMEKYKKWSEMFKKISYGEEYL